MSLSCGIVGLPNAGKSTLFKALTSIPVLIKDYPFSTIKPNVGLVPVDDERLYSLALISKPEKITPSFMKVVDVAGLVKGAHKGEGLGNQFLANLREVSVLIHVIADYEENDYSSESGGNIVDKAETVNQELILSDLDAVEKRIEKNKKKLKIGEKDYAEENNFLDKIHKHLDNGNLIRNMELRDEELAVLDELNLLTIKDIIYVLNRNETNFKETIPRVFKDYADGQQAPVTTICAKLEDELQDLESEERELFKQEYSLEKSALQNIVDNCLIMLELVTFFTVKGDETKAWLLKDKATALEAAGKIHTDMQEGFISVDVIAHDALTEVGSLQVAREKGVLRSEGKRYNVKDGDVLYFRFNK